MRPSWLVSKASGRPSPVVSYPSTARGGAPVASCLAAFGDGVLGRGEGSSAASMNSLNEKMRPDVPARPWDTAAGGDARPILMVGSNRPALAQSFCVPAAGLLCAGLVCTRSNRAVPVQPAYGMRSERITITAIGVDG